MDWQSMLKSVRVHDCLDISRAAKALNEIVRSRVGMRISLTHDVAARHTPIDESGCLLAETVFGSSSQEKVWWKNSAIALESPLVAACRYESDPFWVNSEGFHSMRGSGKFAMIDLTDFEKRAMTKCAIVAPVHLPFGQIGAVSLHSLSPSQTDLSAEYELFAEEFSVLASIFIRSYVSCMCIKTLMPSWSKITKREVECLRWMSLGKTDWEIAYILKRSRATIRFHLNNASQKLGAVNRSQLLLRAGLLGYISSNAELLHRVTIPLLASDVALPGNVIRH